MNVLGIPENGPRGERMSFRCKILSYELYENERILSSRLVFLILINKCFI